MLPATTAPLTAPADVDPELPPQSGRFGLRQRGDVIELIGDLRLRDATAIWKRLRELTQRKRPRQLDFDLSRVTFVDGGVTALLVELRGELVARGVRCEIVGASERFQPLIHLYRGDDTAVTFERPARAHVLEGIGSAAASLGATAVSAVQFLGSLSAALLGVLRRPATGNWTSIPALSERAGADGLPIVALLNFLVGFVMGFQSSHQLELYGANVFVADVVGISITRELAPLMTAIIVSGRSGASFAAELGSMKVSEELDALRTMGFEPTRYLALPRVAALALVTPVLTLLGDVVGVAGGAVVGIVSLGVSGRAYLAGASRLSMSSSWRSRRFGTVTRSSVASFSSTRCAMTGTSWRRGGSPSTAG